MAYLRLSPIRDKLCFEPLAGCSGVENPYGGSHLWLAQPSGKDKLGLSLQTMNSSPSTSSETAFSFPGWSPALSADDSLPPGLRESYRQTLKQFLTFCARRQAGPSVGVAREFVELSRLERPPRPARLRDWKDALNWFFQRGREARAVMLKGVPPLARSDLGGASWEAALIANLRQRGRSWRTEQTYRGWMWRFVKWVERSIHRPKVCFGGRELWDWRPRQP